MHKEFVEDMLHKNQIKKSIDFLHLQRNLGKIDRCQILPVTRKGSVAEHILNSLFLADYCFNHQLIFPPISVYQLGMLKIGLMYHDVEETIMGDIPFYVAKKLDDVSRSVRARICDEFGINLDSLVAFEELMSQFDMLDFLITILGDPKLGLNNNEGVRLRQCRDNAIQALEERIERSHHKVDYRKLLV